MTTARPGHTSSRKRRSKRREIPLVHPGEILRTEFLEPLEISQYRLARDTNVPPRRINEIVKGLRGISADTALRFGIYFDTTPEFWLNLQNHFDIETLRERRGEVIARDVKRRAPRAA
jgi:addiction module HigA family antidote